VIFPVTISLRREQQPQKEAPMGLSALDQLLVLVLEGGASYFTRMLAFGFTEEEIGEAFDEARRAGYTESTGLGADRLTEAGRNRAGSSADS
jgi:hypothetical protein